MNADDRAPGHQLVNVARWILILPTAYVAWSIALYAGLALHSLVDRMCPVDQQVSGLCVATWYPAASKVVFAIGAGLAAALIVVMCTLMAPASRRTVSRVVFAIGSLVALTLALMADAWVEAVTAIVVGALVTNTVWRRASST